MVAMTAAKRFAKQRDLGVIQSGGPNGYDADPPFCSVQLALTRPHAADKGRVHYRFVQVGSQEVAMEVDGDVRWRGPDASDPGFEEALLGPLIESYLRHEQGE
jgi:hypothetical protein